MFPSTESGLRPHTTQYAVIIQTAHNRIIGRLHARENERIKDALNSNEAFLAVTAVRIYDVSGKELLQNSEFLAINRTSIIWVIEARS